MKRTIAMLITLAVAGMTFASPIVYNASFEVPDTPNEWWEPTLADQGGTGWDFFGGAFHAGVAQDNNAAFAAFDAVDGTQMGSLWCGGDEIAQTIHGFVIGQTYQIEWSERARQGYTGGLWVLMDGVTVDAAHAVSDASWAPKSVDFTATSTSHRLRFFHSGGWDTMTHVDAVSVVPEPATMGLFGLLGGGLLWVRKRFTI